MDQHLVEVWRSAKSQGSARLLLSALAYIADAHGVCTASNDELAAQAGICPRSVQVLLRKLVSVGDISCLSPGGSRRGDRRRLLIVSHLSPAPLEIANTEIGSLSQILMSMRKGADSASLFTKAHRLRMLRSLGMVAA